VHTKPAVATKNLRILGRAISIGNFSMQQHLELPPELLEIHAVLRRFPLPMKITGISNRSAP